MKRKRAECLERRGGDAAKKVALVGKHKRRRGDAELVEGRRRGNNCTPGVMRRRCCRLHATHTPAAKKSSLTRSHDDGSAAALSPPLMRPGLPTAAKPRLRAWASCARSVQRCACSSTSRNCSLPRRLARTPPAHARLSPARKSKAAHKAASSGGNRSMTGKCSCHLECAAAL
eukprot:4616721-Pleurochrysis_carterae.AAC.4